MIRNAGACHEMGMSIADMLRAYLGTEDSPSRGRDIHFGDLANGVIAPISMVGALVPVCAGVALSFKLQKKENITLTWAGDGSTRTTAFHEGMMCAKSLSLPLVVFVQDNQIALGTPLESHSAAPMGRVATIYAATKIHLQRQQRSRRLRDDRARGGARSPRQRSHRGDGQGPSAWAATPPMTRESPRKILSEEAFTYWGKRGPDRHVRDLSCGVRSRARDRCLEP